MPIPPSPALDETISVGQTGHIADHEAIADALNELTGQAVGQQGTQTNMTSAATMAAAGNRTGWTYYATDSKILWRFDGTNWRIAAGAVGGSVRRNAAISPANNTATEIVMDTVVEDPCNVTGLGTFFTGGRLQVPTVTGLVLAGLYLIEGDMSWSLGATGLREARLIHSVKSVVCDDARAPASSYSGCSLSRTVRFASGENFNLNVIQTNGGALAVNIFTESSPIISMWRVGD